MSLCCTTIVFQLQVINIVKQVSYTVNVTLNSLRPRRNRRHFADDVSKCIFINQNVLISNKISLKFIPTSTINNMPALVQIMTWRRPGDKPLSEAYIWIIQIARWRNPMETFFALLVLCVGNSPVTGEFPPQRPVTRSFDVFFELGPVSLKVFCLRFKFDWKFALP